MCVQDLFLGRKRFTRTTWISALSGTIKPDAARVNIFFGMKFSDPTHYGYVQSGSTGSLSTPLATLTFNRSYIEFPIERYGDLVVGGWFVFHTFVLGTMVVETLVNLTDEELRRT